MMKHSESPPLPKPNDGYIYSGNIHESVPRTLFLDKRITPLERNAWQVIKMQIAPDGITSLSTYEGLRPYLTSMPGADKASFETVGRAITLLRLTRWMSLVKRRRAPNGAVQGNLYMLHEEPLSIYEAIQLDAEYFALLCRCITHRSKAIQRVAQMVLKEIEEDSQLADKRLPTRLEVLLGRAAARAQVQDQKLSTDSDSEVSQNHLLRNQERQASESEASVKPASNEALRNPKSVSSSSNSIYINTTTPTPPFDLPPRFLLLKKEQQNGALTAMRTLKPDMQRQIVDEWCKHCERKPIGKPAAYLMGMIQKALQGEFNLLAEPAKPVSPVKPVPASIPATTGTKADRQVDREKAKVYIDQIRALVNTWRVTPKRH